MAERKMLPSRIIVSPNSVGMKHSFIRWLVVILLCTWVLGVLLLVPLPETEAVYLEQNKATLREIIAEESKREDRRLTDKELDIKVSEQLSIEKNRLWVNWIVRAAIVIAGLVATLSCLARLRIITLSGVVLTSLAFLVLWAWPYFAAQSSVPNAYRQFAVAVFHSGGIRQIAEFVALNALAPAIHIFAIIFLSFQLVRLKAA